MAATISENNEIRLEQIHINGQLLSEYEENRPWCGRLYYTMMENLQGSNPLFTGNFMGKCFVSFLPAYEGDNYEAKKEDLSQRNGSRQAGEIGIVIGVKGTFRGFGDKEVRSERDKKIEIIRGLMLISSSRTHEELYVLATQFCFFDNAFYYNYLGVEKDNWLRAWRMDSVWLCPKTISWDGREPEIFEEDCPRKKRKL